MSRVARFKVFGRLDRASGATSATVEIDRATNIVTVRPFRRRKTYQMTLGELADWICAQNIRAEIREKRAARAARKKR